MTTSEDLTEDLDYNNTGSLTLVSIPRTPEQTILNVHPIVSYNYSIVVKYREKRQKFQENLRRIKSSMAYTNFVNCLKEIDAKTSKKNLYHVAYSAILEPYVRILNEHVDKIFGSKLINGIRRASFSCCSDRYTSASESEKLDLLENVIPKPYDEMFSFGVLE